MQPDAATASALKQAAQALHGSVRTHKRLELHHRRRSRDLARQLDQLKAQCAQLGIHIELDTAPKEAQSR